MPFRPTRGLPYVDPRTGNISSFPNPLPRQPMLGPPLRRARRGFGDVPTPEGGPGNPVEPYDETDIYNNTPGGGISPYPASAPTPTAATPTATGLSAPFGQSEMPWHNPTSFSTVPILASVTPNVPVLNQNFQRNFLCIQNNSFATAAGDVAPNFYINFNQQASLFYNLQLTPGEGIILDIICPRDSVYVSFGPSVNPGGTVQIFGVVIQGTYTLY